jgi:class 3 adenylate cyclase
MPEPVIATIMFADLMNSTELAKNLTLLEYGDMLVDFQNTMFEVVSHHLPSFGYQDSGVDSEWSISGDELRVFLYSGKVRFDTRNALLIAAKIKLAWLASEFNQKVLREGRLVARIGIGMNCGKVIKDVRKWRVQMGQAEPNIEGYAINLTKRIESTSREGTAYQIMVGANLYKRCQQNNTINVSFGTPRSLTFKGVGQKLPVYEVTSFVNFEVLDSMPETLKNGLMEKLEESVTDAAPEPWIYVALLRAYISKISRDEGEDLEIKAVELARQALEVLEHKATIYNMMGWLYIYGKSVRNLKMAYNCFERSLQLEPKNEGALLNRARILDKMGLVDRARQSYEEILFQNRQHPEALRKVAQYAST